MPALSVSRRTLDVDFVRELRAQDRLKEWIERHPTPLSNPDPESPAAVHHETTRSVILSRSRRYSPSCGRVESEKEHQKQQRDRDNKSVVTLSRSYVPSSPPRTPKRPVSPPKKNSRPSKPSASPTTPSSKRAKGQNRTSTPPIRLKQESVHGNDDSPLGAPRNFLPSPQTERSWSPSYSQPASPSLPRGHSTQKPRSSPPRSLSRRSDSRHDVITASPPPPPPPPRIVAEIEFEEEIADFEDELEAIRELEEQEERAKAIPNRIKVVQDEEYIDGEEEIEDGLEAIPIKQEEEEEEQGQGRIILIERTDEECLRFQAGQGQKFEPSPSPSPIPEPPGRYGTTTFTSLFEIWSRALEEYNHRLNTTKVKEDNYKNNKNDRKPLALDRRPSSSSSSFKYRVTSATDLLTKIKTLEESLHVPPEGKMTINGLLFALSPTFPREGPPCQLCGRASTFGQVSAQNPNGNAHRPFYKCRPCDKWITWADLRGIDGDKNPDCECQSREPYGNGTRLPSRMNITGRKAASGPGRKFYSCAEGRCDFFEWGD